MSSGSLPFTQCRVFRSNTGGYPKKYSTKPITRKIRPTNRIPLLPKKINASETTAKNANVVERDQSLVGMKTSMRHSRFYFGDPLAGFFFANDFVTASFQSPSIFSIGGFRAGLGFAFFGLICSRALMVSRLGQLLKSVCLGGKLARWPLLFDIIP
jgi:hypothetical protein